MRRKLTAVVLIMLLIAGCINSVHVSAGVLSDSDFFVRASNEEEEILLTAVPKDARAPKLKYKKITMNLGSKISVEVVGGSGEITWESTRPRVAKITAKGRVKAVGTGTCRIEGWMDGTFLSMKVKVVDGETVTIKAVGDNLYHQALIDSGLKSDGTRNYDKIYSAITPYIADADIRIINQETMFVSSPEDYSGYPSFGTPLEVGDAMRKAGFNVITLATNHSYDKHETGVLCTTGYWKKYKNDIMTVGMYDNSKDFKTIRVREYNGIKVAFLNYTYGLNGYNYTPLSGEYSEKMTNTVKRLNEATVLNEIKTANTVADAVIVLPHWGKEYELDAGDSQKELAQKMADAGATCIIGTHPHVIEPLEILTSADGREVPCFYSLGNFVSNMFSLETQLEGMAEITLRKVNGEVYVESAKLTPLVNHINRYDTVFVVYRLEEYTDSLAKGHVANVVKSEKEITVDKLWKLYYSVVGKTGEYKAK